MDEDDRMLSIDQIVKILESHLEIAVIIFMNLSKQQELNQEPHEIKHLLMKSKIQTYDIRDSDDFKGVFEVEEYIKRTAAEQLKFKLAERIKEVFSSKKIGKGNVRGAEGSAHPMK